MSDQKRTFERPTPPPLQLRGAFAPQTIDEEARTIDVIFSTGASVRRWRWKPNTWDIEEYDQSLEISERAIDSDFLNSGAAPFLDSHNSQSLDAVLGVIERGSLEIDEGEQARVRVRFDDTDLAERRFRSVKNGILRNVSVGFSIEGNEITREANDKTQTVEELTATRWKPFEVSQVPIGADQGATVRQARAFAARQIEDQKPEGETMSIETTNTENLSAEEREQIAADARAQGVKAEAERQTGIRHAARTLGFDDNHATVTKVLVDGVTLDEARGILIDAAAARDEAQETASTRSDITIGREECQKRGEAISNALMHRSAPGQNKVEPGSLESEYMHRSLMEIARDCLERHGTDTRFMSRGQIAEMALGMGNAQTRAAGMISTSDFPLVLADVANKSLRAGYEQTPRTFLPWTRRVTANDFKTIRRLQLSGGMALAEVPEGSEFTYAKTHEGQESYSISTFGRIVAITRQTLVNDDLDAFSRASQIYGAAAADLESDVVYNLLINNAAMADGVALFHSSHNNIAADHVEAPSASAFGEGRQKMKRQTDLDNDRLLNIAPRYVIFPVAHEDTVDKQLVDIVAATTSNAVPPFIRSLIPIAEPRLDDNSTNIWYMMADPSRIDTIEYAYLAGEEGVQTSTRAGFEVDGVEIKARLDFGAGVIDHRGMYRNAGA